MTENLNLLRYKYMTDRIIAGVDEAGRGALAGPVVATAVILDSTTSSAFFDSKQITDKKRRHLYEEIMKNCEYGIGIIEADEIDAYGIKKSTHKAMSKAVKKLKSKPIELWIDGCDKFQFSLPSRDIIRGDELEMCISAASIMAKVTRDNLMIEYGKKYPEFQFSENKGYGTASHLALLEREQYTPIHRKTYNPLFTYLTQTRMKF